MIDREAIRQRWRLFGSQLDERGRRHFAAVEARTAGRGGIVAVHEITGIARSTIGRGLDELEASVLPEGRVRREGGGRQAVADGDPTLVADLERLVEPEARHRRRCIHSTLRPALVVVLPISSITVARLSSGCPRQFCVMWQNIRCSILFHCVLQKHERKGVMT
jgi:hypothetical protein